MSAPVQRLLRVSRNVSDLPAAVAFYRDALGFSAGDADLSDDPAWGELMGLPGLRGRAVTMQLGEQALQLVACDPPGRGYPADSRSTDLWFQHLAIVVADMRAAYAQLCRHAFVPISEDGPQLLPANTGSVTAFKFRDPDGHPLELIQFPPGVGDPAWQHKTGLFLGIDHSAIDVGDIDRSIDFYTRLLGFSVAARSLNRGKQQERLDHVSGDRVDVVALRPVCETTPHLELLCYRQPAGRAAADAKPNDIAADRLVLQVAGLPELAATLAASGFACVSLDRVTLRDNRQALLVREPDGHMLMLISAAPPAE